MSDQASSSTSSAGSSASPALVAVVPPSNAPRFFAALGNPLRWEMVKMLVKQGPMCATQVATAMKRDFDGVSKHLRVLRQGGVVQSVPGTDRRLAYFRIPPANQPEPGLLDYGLLKIDLRATEAPEPRLEVRA